MNQVKSKGRLSIVATPIGCLEDLSIRALRTLKEADLIVAEDTRHSKKLCAHYEIKTPMKSFHAHSSEQVREDLLTRLDKGEHIALISDAGTPLISDPGYELVEAAYQANISVDALPGPSAVIAALSIAGIRPYPFCFLGFPPRSGTKRREFLERITSNRDTSVIFESPHRIVATLEDLKTLLDSARQIALCRELTKIHEEVIRGSVNEVLQQLRAPARGEVTLVIEGNSNAEQSLDLEAALAHAQELQRRELSTKEISRELQNDFGLSRNQAYELALKVIK